LYAQVTPPVLPDGDPAPPDGTLPAQVADGARDRDLGFYLHVPFCTVRCGYCDFNTYTLTEMSGQASPESFTGAAHREIDLAARVLDAADVPARRISTVFVGGGTPTVLAPGELTGLLAHLRDTFGLAADIEVTTEANPDSVTADSLQRLADGGFTRVSFGMQSAVPHVLATLDRTHDPRRLPEVVGWAAASGLHSSVDLIYGTPGESLADWRTSVETAIALAPEHISAYALTVEPGTRMHRMVRSRQLPDIDPDDQADKYDLADDLLGAAGYRWYEISNFAREPAARSRHNLAYWRAQDWWGIGPGAHSHVGGVRWWNVKHPRAYADRLAAGESPAAAREVLDADARRTEKVMLAVRLADGFDATGLAGIDGLLGDGLVEQVGPLLRLTRPGRLLADQVVRTLLDW
jgi:putative oxygen-independent coproporphyrinogen III oxidase